MKKVKKISILILFLVFASCAENHNYDVTVIKANGFDILVGSDLVTVVTQSGDTLKSFIDQSVLLNNVIPFKAKMEKSSIQRFGYVYSLQK